MLHLYDSVSIYRYKKTLRLQIHYLVIWFFKSHMFNLQELYANTVERHWNYKEKFKLTKNSEIPEEGWDNNRNKDNEAFFGQMVLFNIARLPIVTDRERLENITAERSKIRTI